MRNGPPMLGQQMRAPLVSVLIPVFNGEPFLAECLDSVLAQDFDSFEILLADDQSTDGSPDIIERYARRDSRIRWWRNPHNLGIGANFNACLKAARGRYIKYVLQDDKLLETSALRRMATIMERNPSVSLAACASHLIDGRSRLIRKRSRLGPPGLQEGKAVIVRCLAENTNLIGEPSVTLFRRSWSERGFDERMKQLLDLEMWFHLLEQGCLAYIGEPLCAFRQHPAQYTEFNRRTGAAAREQLMLVERYYPKPWMKDAANAYMIFRVIYQLRKQYGVEGVSLLTRMAESLGSRRYAVCWLRYKLVRPFQNLRIWLQKRGILG